MRNFGRFKKNKNQNIEPEISNRQQVEQLPFEITYSPTFNGNLQVDFYDKNADFRKFYDTTRLIVKSQPLDMEGHPVYSCAVSWYGRNDTQELNKTTGEFDSPRAQAYRGVLAEIDLDLLLRDPHYCNMVMNKLLDRKRVEDFLESGLQETPKLRCGKYIGGVEQTQEGYDIFFSTMVGKASHNSELMVNRRQKYMEMRKKQRREAIERKKAQIEKLQNEMESMEK